MNIYLKMLFLIFLSRFSAVHSKTMIDAIHSMKSHKKNLFSSFIICAQKTTKQTKKNIFIYQNDKININNAHRAEDDAINSGYLFIKIIKVMLNLNLNILNSIYNIYSQSMIINRPTLWLWDLDYDLIRDKPGNDDVEYELIED